jgi:hypothetical protein
VKALKISGGLIAVALIYFFYYNLIHLQFTAFDSLTFAFVQLVLMIPTILGVMLAYKLWTAIILMGAAIIWIIVRRSRSS